MHGVAVLVGASEHVQDLRVVRRSSQKEGVRVDLSDWLSPDLLQERVEGVWGSWR